MREWLVTNGLGGYASLALNGANTRKYHGLLVSSLNPPTNRWVFVSNVHNKIQINGKTYAFNHYGCNFSYNLFPVFTSHFDDMTFKETIFMEYEKNTTILKYDIKTKKPVTIIHTPHVNSRHFYDVTSQRHLNFDQQITDYGLNIRPGNTDKKIKIIIKDATYKPAFFWEEFYYEKDHERHDSWVDNNAHLGDFIKKIKKDTTYYIVLTLEDDIKIDPSKVFNKETYRRKSLIEQSELDKKFEKLVLSTDNFVVNKEGGKSIVAGYHWFGDWGRDTLIALPGTALVTKRFDDAKQILLSFSMYCKNGLIPNAFMDRDSKPVYNTVDASLWYIDRVYQYYKYTNDKEFLNEIWETLQSIINGYIYGTDFNIYMDEDYLISHGPGLTWMDVKIGDYYPTPRSNKAVEIQALWYNALRIMRCFSQILGKSDIYHDLSEKVKESFNKQYDQQYDVIDKKDLSFRPNQIFLVSLDFTMINDQLAKKIVDNVENKLFTIFGLRTLSPDDSRYKGHYIGDYNKDIAYHNGTVWPWLTGSFIKAFVKVNNNTQDKRTYAFNTFLKPMLDVFGDKWDGNIFEIFDAEPIYAPQGCIAQAWSVAEILRCWVEDIENIKPEIENISPSPKICV